MPGPPMLMRRANGVVGTVLAPGTASSSSMALPSTESELVEMLPRRMPKDGLLAAPPDRPRVLTDRRRPRASLGEPFVCDVELPRWNRFDKAAWVMELRRLRGAPSPPPPPPFVAFSEDIVAVDAFSASGKVCGRRRRWWSRCRLCAVCRAEVGDE